MARARNIKPSIMDNEELAELAPLTRLLFIYLWMLADREGRIEDRPKRIAAQALAYDRQADIEAMLDSLQSAGFLTRYTAGDTAVIHITAFSKHQTPHIREAASTLPKPEAVQAKARPKHNLGTVESSPRSPDSGFRIPDSLIPDTPSRIPDCGLLIPVPTGTLFGDPPAEDSPAPVKAKREPKAKEQSSTSETWGAYSIAYMDRYGVDPVRNAMVNGQLSQFVGRVGATEAPSVAAWYVGHQNRFYVEVGHSVAMLLRDAEKLRTEWATNRRGTSTQALQADKTQTNLSAFAPMIEEARKREQGQ